MPDPYLLPNGTLRNKLGKTDPDALARAEGEIVAAREAQLRGRHYDAPNGLGDLQDIHRHLFQDVYDWAGRFRAVDLRKRVSLDAGGVSVFTPPGQLEAEAREIDRRLLASGHLRGLPRENFAVAAADLFVAVNRLHPFREGNGRAQRLFMERLAVAAGHKLDFTVVTRERMVAVSVAGHTGDVAAVERLFTEISDAARVAALRKALAFLARTEVAWNDLYIATTVSGQVYRGVLVARDPGRTGDFMLRVDEPTTRLLAGMSGDLPEDARPGDDFEVTVSNFGPP